MAAGDFLIIRNASDTSALPNTGTNLDVGWDTSVMDSGALSYGSNVVTVPSSSPYLIIYNEYFYTSDTTNNERIMVQSEILINGSPIVPGRGGDYIRKSNGNQECMVSGCCIVELIANDTIQIRFYRTDDSVSGVVNRVVDYGGLQVLELSTSDSYGIYSTSSNITSTTSFVDIVWGTNDRQDTGFSRSLASITITNAGRYLVSVSGDVSMISDTRTELLGQLKIGGIALAGCGTYSYMRGIDANRDSGISGIFLVDVSASDILTYAIKHLGATCTLISGFQIAIWRIPSSGDEIIVEATTGDINAQTSGFTWDTNPHIDIASFTHTTGNANIDVDVLGHYLFLASVRKTAVDTIQRAVPLWKFRVGSTTNLYGGASSYHRNSGGVGAISQTAAAILTSILPNTSVQIETTLSAAAGTIDLDTGQFVALNLESLWNYTYPPVIANVNTDNKIGVDELNNIITGVKFEATQGTGKVELASSSDYTTATKVTQTIDSWADTSIQFDVVSTGLDEGGLYIFITVNGGSRTTGHFVSYGEATHDNSNLSNCDHYWSLNNNYTDSGFVGSAPMGTNTQGTPTFINTAICRSTSYSLELGGLTDRSGCVDNNEMNLIVLTRRTMGGWVQLGGIQQTLAGLYKEGGQVNNFCFLLGIGNILMAQAADTSDFNVQAFSDVNLSPNRPYHICFQFSSNTYNNEFLMFIDGTEQTKTSGNPPGATNMDAHSGNITWGDPDSNLEVGGTDIAFNGPNDCLYSHWGSWSEANVLTATQIRKDLFEAGAIPTVKIAGTQTTMQTALGVYNNTTRPDWPLGFRIAIPTGSSNLELTATNIVMNDKISCHLRWMGSGTLTWRNSGTSNASIVSTPNAGTVVFIETVSIVVIVKDNHTLSAIQNARVYIEADSGGPLPSRASVTIVRSVSTATVTHTAHGLVSGNKITIRGAIQPEYNITAAIITVASANTYTYTISGTPNTPATGTITATTVIYTGLTDVNGEIAAEIDYTTNQPIIGKIRKSSTNPKYITAIFTTSVGSTGLETTIFLISDDIA